jgi:hypothetical protein
MKQIIFICFSTISSINLIGQNKKLIEIKDAAFVYCKSNNLDTTKCILMDMSIHSGLPRFFVWDFIGDSILMQSQACNGKNSEPNKENIAKYSNVKYSNCSSLGKYAVMERSYSKYGVNFHYKLDGLEATNSNARKRVVVLHGKDEVSDIPIYPKRLVTSSGCPTVSNSFMLKLDVLLKNKTKPVLLWIFQM